MQLIFITLFVVHFDISGKYNSDLQWANIPDNTSTWEVFHLEILGNEVIDEQPLNI
jgi:hypothetical protein